MRIGLLEKQNPFVKVVTILICGVLLIIGNRWQINIMFGVFCLVMLLFLSKCSCKALLGFYAMAALMALMAFWAGFKYGKVDEAAVSTGLETLSSALMLGTRVVAYVGLGITFALTSDSEEFILSLMHQCHLKPKFAYGVLAAHHLVPALRKEFDEAKLAYRVRGKTVGPFAFGPLFNALVNGIHWSEAVAMAMESKGFDGDGPRTFYKVTKVTAFDIALSAFMLAVSVAFIVIGKVKF